MSSKRALRQRRAKGRNNSSSSSSPPTASDEDPILDNDSKNEKGKIQSENCGSVIGVRDTYQGFVGKNDGTGSDFGGMVETR